MENAMEHRCSILLESDPASGAITLSIRGKLDGEAIATLESSLRGPRAERMRIYVDLSEVTLVDHETVRYLSGARQPDVTYVNCPDYLRRWIFSDVSDGPVMRKDA
jgi:hypothetical protein